MSISKDDVLHVANLARLHLDEQEVTTYTKQLNDILAYAQELQELDTEGVKPTYHAIDMPNVLREDEVVDFANKKQLLSNGPDTTEDCFVVPKILG